LDIARLENPASASPGNKKYLRGLLHLYEEYDWPPELYPYNRTATNVLSVNRQMELRFYLPITAMLKGSHLSSCFINACALFYHEFRPKYLAPLQAFTWLGLKIKGPGERRVSRRSFEVGCQSPSFLHSPAWKRLFHPIEEIPGQKACVGWRMPPPAPPRTPCFSVLIYHKRIA
jgi:hypothetical protein